MKKMYEKLPDGLHPGEETLEDWGKIISVRIDKNFSMAMAGGTNGCSAARARPITETNEVERKRMWKSY